MDALYIEISDALIAPKKDAKEQPYKVAKVIFNGKVLITKYSPNFGVYKSEGVSESSTIAAAQIEFARCFLHDIRRANGTVRPNARNRPIGATADHARSVGGTA
jgi:hypothetical protein